MDLSRVLRVSCIVLLCASAGCTAARGSVPLRADGSPGPEECSEEALKTMRILRMRVGDAAKVELDANQIDRRNITLYDGPVESYLDGPLGMLEAGTRLYGHVWTSGRQIVVRYYEAHPVDGEPVPICAVGRDISKKSDSRPGLAVLDYSGALVFVVNSFR
ncbi:serine/threonine protein kinase [Pyxidicoccus fallax]|uniref:Serine/threonine protein kinase n=1 Tax=Pyxidicoccus fallax TaxID=394095 RepID=A0A848LYK4_9BACT|nr:serine/threonine protein kinase [Pyxidicoccus fallax]NMO22709.1 serine/threonine protein kinase [Pyxidicoccus fallax]NPC84841.1 serine/threonine protein kinase [Pyxidicoccus fallax]